MDLDLRIRAAAAAGLLTGLIAGCGYLFLESRFFANGLYSLGTEHFLATFELAALLVCVLHLGATSWLAADRRRRTAAARVLGIAGLVPVVALPILLRSGWLTVDIPLLSLGEGSVRIDLPVRESLVVGVGALGCLVACWASVRILPSGKMRRRSSSVALALAVTCAPGALIPANSWLRHLRAGSFPNVVLISVDTLRADHLGSYGYGEGTSPNLDALADEAIRFDTAIAPMSHTLPSHTSLMTGLNPLSHGVRMNGMKLRRDLVTMAEVLKNAGFRTAAIAGSTILDESTGFSRGFDFYSQPRSSLARAAGAVGELARQWLDRSTDRPFFLFVHFWDPHSPYSPPERFVEEATARVDPEGSLYQAQPPNRSYWEAIREPSMEEPTPPGSLRENIGRYDGEIRYVDSEIGKLLDRLEQAGRRDDTLVIVTSDHGESLGERGLWGHELFYEEQVRVPLILKLPGAPQAGVVEGAVGTVNLMPTVLDALGVSTSVDMQGKSLVPRFSSAGTGPVEPIFIERRAYPYEMRLTDPQLYGLGQEVALRDRRWKYVSKTRESEELYDLRKDPGELRNLSCERPGVVAALEERIRIWRNTRGSDSGDPTREMDEKSLEQLRALGYIR